MARKKTERIIRQAYSDERKASKPAENEPSTSSTRGKPIRKLRLNNNGYFAKDDKHFISFNNQLTCMGLMIRNINGDG